MSKLDSRSRCVICDARHNHKGDLCHICRKAVYGKRFERPQELQRYTHGTRLA